MLSFSYQVFYEEIFSSNEETMWYVNPIALTSIKASRWLYHYNDKQIAGHSSTMMMTMALYSLVSK